MNTFQSLRFGELTYAEGDVITLPEGLVGLPRLKRWILLDMERPLPLKWLQSLDDGSFGVPVISAEYFAANYDPRPSEAALRRIGGGESEDVAVLVITTVGPGGTRLTGNLAAPLLIHTGTRRGVQHVIEDQQWSLRQEIDYVRFGLAAQEGNAPVPQEQAIADLSAAATRDGERQEIAL